MFHGSCKSTNNIHFQLGSRDIYAGGHSQLMETKCDELGFSHLAWKEFPIILKVNIIYFHFHLDLNLVSHTHKSCTDNDNY